MRVTIDAVPLLVRSAGVKNYLYYWTRHLSREARGVEIRLFPFLGAPGPLDHEESVAHPVMTHARLGLLFLLNHIPNDVVGWMDPAIDLFHTCKLLHPPRRAKLTATVHDFTCWLLPETHPPANVAADRAFGERILKRADGLIAVSEATRSDAVRLLKLPPEKIRVIHHGIADMYFRATAADAEAVRSRHGLRRPYVLFVGTIEPRKNVDLLLDAYQGLPASIREEFELVLAGPPGWAQRATMARLQQLAPGDALPGLRGGGGPGRPLRRRGGIRLSFFIRGLRLSGGAGDGGGNPGDYLGRIGAAGDRGRCGHADRPAQRNGAAGRHAGAADFARAAGGDDRAGADECAAVFVDGMRPEVAAVLRGSGGVKRGRRRAGPPARRYGGGLPVAAGGASGPPGRRGSYRFWVSAHSRLVRASW